MSQTSVLKALESIGGIGTAQDIAAKLIENGETGDVISKVWHTMTLLKKNKSIDFTLSTLKIRGSPARIYRLI